MAEKKIKKIKLSNGEIYSIFDNNALRVNEDGKLITGNGVVDKILLDGDLIISEIDDIPVEQPISNVLVQDDTTGKIMKRSTDDLLEDIDGMSYKLDGDILAIKIGKFEN